MTENNNSNQSKFTCALFDFDGTLVDSETVLSRINQEYINLYGDGKEYTWELKRKVMGTVNANETLIKEHHITKTPQEMKQFKEKRCEEISNEFKPFPKALELVKFLKENGLKVAIATSSSKKFFDIKSVNCKEILKYIDILVCGDNSEVKKSKPEPDIFIYSAKLLGETDMSKTIVFEDAINGVKAGLASGAFTIAIPDSHCKDDPTFTKANVLLNSIEEFKPEMIGLKGKI